MNCVVLEFSWDDPDFPLAMGLDGMCLGNKTQFQVLLLSGVYKKSTFLT